MAILSSLPALFGLVFILSLKGGEPNRIGRAFIWIGSRPMVMAGMLLASLAMVWVAFIVRTFT